MKYLSTICAKLLLIICCVTSLVNAQTLTSSPYSRYGIGDLQSQGFVKNRGMSGLGYSLSNAYTINYNNPASYSSLILTSFEAAASASFYELKTSTASGTRNNKSFGYFALGFPLKQKKAGMALGLIPYSNVGYEMSEKITNTAGAYETRQYKGSGGLNQFFLGAGLSPWKNFSVGANLSFLFGSIDQDRRIFYEDVSYFNTKVQTSSVINDFYYSLGVQKTFDSIRLGKKDSTWTLNIGLVGSPSVSLKGKHTVYAGSYIFYNQDQTIELDKDTIINTEDKSGKLVLPWTIGLGVSLQQMNHWLIGVDFSTQNWQDYSLFGEKDLLENSWRTALGAQWTPNDRSNRSYFNLVQYRLGVHYEQTYLQINDSRLNDIGVSLGFGFPVKRGLTTFQFSLEAGRRGTTESSLIEVNYLKFMLAFTLGDVWFIKPKID